MARVEYQARILPGSGYIEKTRPTELSLGMYSGGALVAPSSGVVSVYNVAGNAVVTNASVTITGSRAYYTTNEADFITESLGTGWRIEWLFTMPDGFDHLVRQDASCVRVRLPIPISHVDLLARHSDLDDQGITDFDDYLDEAHYEIVARLEARGRRPYLVMDPAALRMVYLYTTLAIVAGDFAGSGAQDNTWRYEEEKYRGLTREAWSEVTFDYDEDDDGKSSGERRRASIASLWLGGSRRGA
jgi:hypothetical protein